MTQIKHEGWYDFLPKDLKTAVFRVTVPDINKENALHVQGSISQNSSKDIAGIMFQNFDTDTKTMHNMASISMRDHFGNATQNGYGDLLLKTTNPDVENVLSERLRITYNGMVGIGTSNPINTLDVHGSISSSIWNVGTVLVCSQNNTATSATVAIDELNTLRGIRMNVQQQLDLLSSNVSVGGGSGSNISLPQLSADVAVITDNNGLLTSSTTTTTELSYLSGLRGPIQSQIDATQPTITGAASTITSATLPVNSVVMTDDNGNITSSSITSTELSYLSSATSSIQTQLDSKQATVTGALTTFLANNATANRAIIADGTGKLNVSPATATEVSYLTGATSNIQGQLNALNIFGTSNNNAYLPNGFFGIGTSSPSVPLTVSGMIMGSSFATSSMGTATNPAYTFSNNTSTGLFEPIANTLAVSTLGNERLRVGSNGYFGIGVTVPTAPVEVVTGISVVNMGSSRYFNASSGTALLSSSNFTSTVSIVSNSSIWVKNGWSLIASSDERIKTNIELANLSTVSDLFDNINLYHYNYIDNADMTPEEAAKGVYGFIAQEVHSVYSPATNVQCQAVPSVYSMSSSLSWVGGDQHLEITLLVEHHLTEGQRIEFYTKYSDTPVSAAVIGVFDEHTIVVQVDPEQIHNIDIAESVFVYGYVANDFLALDKNMVMALCYGQVKELKSTVASLQQQITALQQQMADMSGSH